MSHEGPPSGRSDPGSSEGVPNEGDVIAFKYKVERVLGVGGMGVVVAARHLQLGQRVAIKFIRGEAATDRNALERFLREARAAVALSSEHVTKVLDVGTLDTGAPYMVMEYLEGEDLSALLERRGPMPIVQAVDFVLQACEGLAEAHATGIVHRDLKPSNLFVTKRRDGTPLVKVLDFGISKMTEFNTAGAQEMLTASGLVMGSPGYMSPEQVRNAKAADARSDIWALGVILYELLSGVSPFIGDTIGDTFARIISETPKPLRHQRPEVPEGLAAVITQCWERRIDRRTQSVGDLAAQLSPFASREAAISVERIRRIAGAHSSPAGGSETLAAPDSTLAFTDRGQSPAGGSIAHPETERSWLRSGTSEASRPKATPVLGIALTGVLLVAGVVTAVTFFARSQASPPSATNAVQAPGDSARAAMAPSPAAPAAIPHPAEVAPPPLANREVEVPSVSDAGEAPALHAAQKPAAGAPRVRSPSKPAGDPSLDSLLDRRQ